ncbi:MAG: hypothetical protein ABL890_00325 [Candidatus Peribacteraceae bacterium]
MKTPDHYSDFSLERAAKLWASCHDLPGKMNDEQIEAVTRHLSVIEQSGSGLITGSEIAESRARILHLFAVDTPADSVRADTVVGEELVES